MSRLTASNQPDTHSQSASRNDDAARADSRCSSRFTRMGLHFLFVGTFAMLGGALRGFNLLLILAGLIVGTLIMHWRWSRRSVESLSATRRLPGEAFAGVPFRVRYRVRNHSRFLPAWMVRVEEKIVSADTLGERASAACGTGMIGADQIQFPHFDCTIQQRGRYQFGPIQLVTSFPFSLFKARQTVFSEDSLHVFPALLPMRGAWQRQLISRADGTATTSRRSGPNEGDFFGLREWQTGDSPKWIHWRTTARLDEPAVRQFEQQRRFQACMLIDGFASAEALSRRNPAARARALADVEHAISLTATLLVHLVGSPTNRLILAVAASETTAIIGGGNDLGKRRMLETLAALRPNEQNHLPDAINKASEMVGRSQDLIVISPRSFAEARRADPGLVHAVAPWNRRSSLRWIDVREPELQRWAGSIEKQMSMAQAPGPPVGPDQKRSSDGFQEPVKKPMGTAS